MKTFTLENAMIKAIREFKKQNKNYHIRNVYSWEWCSHSALFNIEYVDENGIYHETQIKVINN